MPSCARTEYFPRKLGALRGTTFLSVVTSYVFVSVRLNQLDAMPSHPDERTRTLGPLHPNFSKIAPRGQRSGAKPESTFFTKLPPEVRTLIYTYTVGGTKFYIVQSGQRLVRKRCWIQPRSYSQLLGASDPCQVIVCDWGPLAFLQTCRQV